MIFLFFFQTQLFFSYQLDHFLINNIASSKSALQKDRQKLLRYLHFIAACQLHSELILDCQQGNISRSIDFAQINCIVARIFFSPEYSSSRCLLSRYNSPQFIFLHMSFLRDSFFCRKILLLFERFLFVKRVTPKKFKIDDNMISANMLGSTQFC